MTRRQRVQTVYELRKPDRIPFVPAIYEHKAKLIGRSPSEVCRDAGLLQESLAAELRVYDPDMLVVGIDVYNVEAEALGCKVTYFEDSNHVPGIATPLIEGAADLGRLGAPDPERDGRMPLFVEAAAALQRQYGEEMIVRGALTGPFSMASELVGAERFLMAVVEDPAFARRLMEFTAEVTALYGAAFLRRGVEPIVFDSRATPQLCSPRVFRGLVAPIYRDIVTPRLKAAGARWIPLIIGGNTTGVIDDLIATGATQLLCDANADLDRFLEKTRAARVPFRANIDARLVHSGPKKAIRAAARAVLLKAKEHPGFLLGCGVVAYDCDPAHVLAMREVLEEAATQPAN
jgi:uroporphyrinogen decarboxylase